jgi:Putative porin
MKNTLASVVLLSIALPLNPGLAYAQSTLAPHAPHEVPSQAQLPAQAPLPAEVPTQLSVQLETPSEVQKSATAPTSLTIENPTHIPALLKSSDQAQSVPLTQQPDPSAVPLASAQAQAQASSHAQPQTQTLAAPETASRAPAQAQTQGPTDVPAQAPAQVAAQAPAPSQLPPQLAPQFAAPAPAAENKKNEDFRTQPGNLSAPPWKPEYDWAGDIRYRANNFKDGANDARLRQQLRARLAFKAGVDENLTAILRLATTTGAITSNQVLGDDSAPGMQKRFFGLDQAFLEYRPMESTSAWLGRTANPFYSSAKNQLVFDTDLDFEGFSFRYGTKSSEKVRVFANAAYSIIAENYNAAQGKDLSDVSLVGAQMGVQASFHGLWTLYGGVYEFLSLRNHPVTNVAAPSPASLVGFYGNSTKAGTPATIASEFQIFELGLSLKETFSFAEAEIFFDSTYNDRGLNGRSAFETGLQMKRGKWQAGFALISKEADSVVGAFTDSDTNGGGTDNRGTRINIAYQFARNAQLVLTDYRARHNKTQNEGRNFNATHFDVVVNF